MSCFSFSLTIVRMPDHILESNLWLWLALQFLECSPDYLHQYIWSLRTKQSRKRSLSMQTCLFSYGKELFQKSCIYSWLVQVCCPVSRVLSFLLGLWDREKVHLSPTGVFHPYRHYVASAQEVCTAATCRPCTCPSILRACGPSLNTFPSQP